MGLTEKQVVESRVKYGSNEITIIKQKKFVNMLLNALADPIIKILLLALIIKIIFLFRDFDWFETIGILIAVLMATFISSISEYSSEKVFNKLQEDNSKIKSKVYRDGILKEINIDQIVVNDIVQISTGDKIPADGYIINGNLSLDESALNGETKEAKKVSVIKNQLPVKNNIIYRGSVVYSGSAICKINKVGINTIYGNITKELNEKTIDSPLKIRLRTLANSISKLGYVGAFIVSSIYLFNSIVVANNFDIDLIIITITNFSEMFEYILYALTLSVTIIVVAVPEGLPMMITLVLSSNMKKMMKDNVLVRNMIGIETAGNINYLLTDKTGTLTKGKLFVTKFMTADNKEFFNYSEIEKNNKLKKIIQYSLYYNNEAVFSDNEVLGGNSTDRAIMSFISKKMDSIKMIKKEEFDSEKKYSCITVLDEIEKQYYKGASEVLLEKCKYYYDKYCNQKPIINIKYIKDNIKQLTTKGNRVIVLTEKKENDYIYIGLLAIKDELRKEATKSINIIKKAGINVIMITGDSKDTAKVIAKESGIITNIKNLIITSDDLNKLTDEEVIEIIPNIKVIARALPQDKSRLVKILQKMNQIVGMTGDGVNDAPALKKANVGFSMGSGTEVAKEASDIIIIDNNILSISKAILYGRTIFKSIRKFIIYQLSINVCALTISIIGSILNISEPITIMQMLWLNMIMDTFAGLAFSFETPLKEYMEEKPKKINEPIVNKYMLSQILTTGIYCAVVCLLFLKLDIIKLFFRTGENNIYLYTSYFALFIFLGVYNAFNARTTRINIFSSFFKNKIFLIIFLLIIFMQIYIIYFGGSLFRTYGMTLNEIMIIMIISLSILPVDIIRKIYFKSKGYQSLI